MPSWLEITPPPGVRKFHSKQSELGEHLPSTAFRIVVLGPGSSGKTLAMQSMILNHYRGVFQIFSLESDIKAGQWRGTSVSFHAA